MDMPNGFYWVEFLLRLAAAVMLVRTLYAKFGRKGPLNAEIPARAWGIALLVFMIFQPPLILLIILLAISRSLRGTEHRDLRDLTQRELAATLQAQLGKGHGAEVLILPSGDPRGNPAPPSPKDPHRPQGTAFGALRSGSLNRPTHRGTPRPDPSPSAGPFAVSPPPGPGPIWEDKPWWQFW